jgi:hypothetical protein
MTVLSTQTGHFRDALLDLANALALIEGGGDIAAPRMERISGVKVKIDEMMPESEGSQFSVEDDDNNTNILDLYINSRLDPAAVVLHQIAPLSKINGKAATNDAVVNADHSGYVILPSDFIRLKAFKMVGWLTDVSKAYTPEDPIYKKQKSVYIRGGKVKPVCILNEAMVAQTVTKVLEYYSMDADDNHNIEKFIYVPEVAAEDVQANLTDALEWICAKDILQITGRPQEDIKMAEGNIQTCFVNLK